MRKGWRTAIARIGHVIPLVAAIPALVWAAAPTVNPSEHSPILHAGKTGLEWPQRGPLRVRAHPIEGSTPARIAYDLVDAKGQVVMTLPDPYGSGEWWYDRTVATAFEDIDGDHREDILIIADYLTGIGPEGAKPFPVASVYLRRGAGFKPATALNERLNNGQHAKQVGTLAGLIPLARALLHRDNPGSSAGRTLGIPPH
jgi:hypothetical protein